ncbi:hypothetical protein EDD36DRAFT_306992 [Exophiala viscosa]|uniref:DUF6603 domain-containing protein n=1 Tax=Exophiala viscosa TaxID=2486360 RepID=A0AAN6DQP8_9EURO|nr:hypothetical protein EDD36DRAFT_306992 [Exophiala viscosa]
MAGDDSSLSIFNASEAISQSWVDFLSTDTVDCPVVAGTSASGGAGTSVTELTCTSKTRCFGLSFDTASNQSRFSTSKYSVDDNTYLLSLTPDAFSKQLPGLEEVLEQFGVFSSASSSTGDQFIDNLVKNGVEKIQIDPNITSRNALWLSQGQVYRCDVALTLTASLNGTFGKAIKERLGFKKVLSDLGNCNVLLQRTCIGVPSTISGSAQETWSIDSTYSLSFNFDAAGFAFWVTLDPVGVRFDMIHAASTDWSDLTALGVTNKLDGSQPLDINSSQPSFDKVLSDVQLLRLSAGVSLLDAVWWDITASITVTHDQGESHKPLQIFLDFQYPEKIFTGGLVTEAFYSAQGNQLLPTFLPWQAIKPPDGLLPGTWDLSQLSSKVSSLPPGLPTQFQEANVVLNMNDPKSLSFTAILGPRTPPMAAAPPTVPWPSTFEWDTVNLQTSTASNSFSCSLSTTFTLNPSPLAKDADPAHIGISVDYNNGDWLLSGYAQNLNCGNLADCFEAGYQNAMADLLGKITIAELDLTYAYDKQNSASSFLFMGIITLGELQLRLVYQYASSQAGSDTAAKKVLTGEDAKLALDTVSPKDGKVTSNWSFECDLEASAPNATVRHILDSIVDDAADNLPDFIANILIPQGDGRDLVTIKVGKKGGAQADDGSALNKGTSNIMFVLRIMIDSFALFMIQVSNPDPTVKSKRMLRFAVESLIIPVDFPLVGKPPLPFDELEYVWVNQGDGFTESDVQSLNDNMLSGQDVLVYKQTNSGDSTTSGPVDPSSEDFSQADEAHITKNKNPDPVALVPGHHFMVVRTQTCVLDHVFVSTPVTAPDSKEGEHTQRGGQVVKAAAPPADEPTQKPPSKGNVTYSLGPLTFSAVSLQYKDTSDGRFIAFTFDATFTMGPLIFALLGFGLDIPLPANMTFDSLSHPDTFLKIMEGASPTLTGMSFSFSKPPVLIAGGFEHEVTKTPEGQEHRFFGAVGIGFPPYTFVGMGEYAVVKHAGSDYKSAFLYAKLDGPVVTVEFATIEGVRLGIGYNSLVRQPTIDEIYGFPLIDDGSTSGVGNDPMALLKIMVEPPSGKPPWVTPQNGEYWLAAGMTITAFAVLSITAVAMFEFGETGLIISLFADAVATMPPTEGTARSDLIAYAELGVVAEMNFSAGYLRVDAALSPTSFLLVPECHIFGGFALSYWFSPNEHAGDWVFSLGGYHKAYQPPAWYPVPSRVGVSFQAGLLSVTGESYFAITPQCVMGGSMLHASMSLGPIQAWLDTAFDALINFHPLHYNVSFSVSIGVSFNIDFWFVHIHIGATVGAHLQIQGPQLGGIAHVDFYLFGFDVNFGASPSIPSAQSLDQFWTLVHKPGPSPGSTSNVEAAHQSPLQSCLSLHPPLPPGTQKTVYVAGAAHKFILEDGNFPQPKTTSDTSTTSPPPNTGAGAPWYVKAGTFKFRIGSEFALSEARMVVQPAPGGQTNPNSPIFVPAPAPFLFSRPMRVSREDGPIWSSLQVTVYYEKGTKDEKIISNWSNLGFDIKNVPAATWAPYDVNLDPIFSTDPKAMIGQNGGPITVPLAMALKLSAPPPILAESFIPAFYASDAAKFGILDFRTNKTSGTDWHVPVEGPLQTNFIPRALTQDEKPPDPSLSVDQQRTINKMRWAKVKTTWSALATDPAARSFIGGKTSDPTSTPTAAPALAPVTPATTSAPAPTPALAQEGMIALFKTLCAWDTQRPKDESPVKFTPPGATAATTIQPWDLNVAFPLNMISGFDDAYMDLPRMGIILTPTMRL